MKAFTDIKEKAHQIAWETSKDYDPLLSKEAWCEMAALDMASWLEKQGEQTWKPSAAQLIVIKDLIEDKNTSKVNKTILRGMLDDVEQLINSHKREIDDAYLQGICDAKYEIEKQGKKLDADEVIAWLECKAFQGWAEEINIKQIVDKFKRDFKL